MTMKIHIMIVRGSDPLGILKDAFTAMPEACTYQEIEVHDLKSTWNKNTKAGVILVCSSYMIESVKDAEVVLRFIQSMQYEPGNKFYAPRPNSYMVVERPEIYGTALQNPYSLSFKSKVFYVARQQARKLPNPVKVKLVRLIQKLAFNLRWMKTNAPLSEYSFKPIISVPAALSDLAGPWLDWRDEEALRHDLIERNHLYFPHPTSMHIAVSNTCNLKCVMCPYYSPVYKDAHTTGYFDQEKSLSLASFERLAVYAGQRRYTHCKTAGSAEYSSHYERNDSNQVQSGTFSKLRCRQCDVFY